MTRKTLAVTGPQTMHCEGCERAVTFSLSAVEGVKVLNADHRTQTIEFMLGDETSLQIVQAELSSIGYVTVERDG